MKEPPDVSWVSVASAQDSEVTMAREPERLTLDKEVSDFVTRVGALAHPQNHIVSYIITRDFSDPARTFINIVFISDEQFSTGEKEGAHLCHE